MDGLFFIFLVFLLVLGISKNLWFHEVLRAKKKWKKLADKHGWRLIHSDNFELKYSPFKMELTYKGHPVVVEWQPFTLADNNIQELLNVSSDIMTEKFTKFTTTNNFKGEIAIKKKYGIQILSSHLPEYLGSLSEASTGYEEYDRKFYVYASSPELPSTFLTRQSISAHQIAPYSSIYLCNGNLTLLCSGILTEESKILSMLDLLSEINISIN